MPEVLAALQHRVDRCFPQAGRARGAADWEAVSWLQDRCRKAHLVRWRSLRATLGPCSSQLGPVPVSSVATLLSDFCCSASSAD